MIQAIATPQSGRLKLEFTYPDRKTSEIISVASHAEAIRIVYFRNREYMVAKLRGWLKQRMYSGDQVRSSGCARLLVLLGYYENASFKKICSIVHDHRAQIGRIAPGPQSRYYNHYKNVIEPLLDDAAEMGGGA